MLCLASCKGSDDNETTQSVTQMPSQTTTYESDVTAVNTDEEKGESLKSDITGFFDGAGEVDGVFSNGSFTYKNTRQASVMYAYERDSALEEKRGKTHSLSLTLFPITTRADLCLLIFPQHKSAARTTV